MSCPAIAKSAALRQRKPPSPTWRTFLDNHGLLSCLKLVVCTIATSGKLHDFCADRVIGNHNLLHYALRDPEGCRAWTHPWWEATSDPTWVGDGSATPPGLATGPPVRQPS